MDFGVNPKYQDLVERAKTYARDMLAPRAEGYDQEGHFPRENFEDLHKECFTAITLPDHLGGRDLYSDPSAYSTVLYELSKGCTNTAMLFHMQSSIIHVLSLLGTEEQAARYAQAIHNGKIFASHASENSSSLHGKMVMDTHAKRAGDKYLVNGQKYFCSMAGEADYYVLWCQLGDEPDLSKSLYLFVVSSDAPGLKIDREWNSFAMQGTMSHSMTYEDVEVASNDIVGEGGDPIRSDILPKFGYGYSAVYLGAGGGAFDWVVEYAKNRKLQPDNVPIATYPSIARQIGEMKIALDGALLMVQRAGWLMGTQEAGAAYGAINEAKFTAAETAAMITEKAIKIAGGPGLMRDFPLQRFHREARAGLIMPPNTEKCLELAGKTAIEGKAGALMT